MILAFMSLFSNAELTEDDVKDLLDIHPPCDPPQVRGGMAQFFGSKDNVIRTMIYMKGKNQSLSPQYNTILIQAGNHILRNASSDWRQFSRCFRCLYWVMDVPPVRLVSNLSVGDHPWAHIASVLLLKKSLREMVECKLTYFSLRILTKSWRNCPTPSPV